MSASNLAIDVRNISKTYVIGQRDVRALSGLSLQISHGEYVSIVGPSGCGKSTLLNILAGIDTADQGEVHVLGTRLDGLGQDQLATWRGRSVGIVFQFFQLMPTLTALENVMLPMDLAGRGGDHAQRAATLLERTGLAGRADNLPSEMSGGEQQRVAVARALANSPTLILADEPTGNLDSANGQAIVEIIESLWEEGTTIVMVTHDPSLAQRATRRISMNDGQIVNDVGVAATDASTAIV